MGALGGSALAAWVQTRTDTNAPAAVWVSRYAPGSGWSTPVALPATTGVSRDVRVVLLPDGTGLVFTWPTVGELEVMRMDATGALGATGQVAKVASSWPVLLGSSARGDVAVVWRAADSNHSGLTQLLSWELP